MIESEEIGRNYDNKSAFTAAAATARVTVTASSTITKTYASFNVIGLSYCTSLFNVN